MRTNERSRNNFVISTAICLMVALNSTVAKSANEQGANKIADAVKAVNSEANKQYDKTDNTKAIRYSGESSDAKYDIAANRALYCYPKDKDVKHKNPECLNCETNGDHPGINGKPQRCKVVPTYEVNGYNLPIYMSVDSNGFIKGLKDVIKPNEKLSANGKTLNLANDYFYRYWDESKGDYSSAYPVVCSSGYNGVSDNLEQVKKQFTTNQNKYVSDDYVMRIGFKPYNYDYAGGCGTGYLKVAGNQWETSASDSAGGCSIGNCLVPNVSASSGQYLNIETGDSTSLSKSNYLPCGLKDTFESQSGYPTQGVCGDEYIKRYEDSQGNTLMTTYKAWLINDKQGDIFNSSYRTFDVPSRACYECKSTSIGNYCEEVINELITYCDKPYPYSSKLECIVARAVLGGKNMKSADIAEGRLPKNLNCGGCLSKLETILKSKGFN